MTIEFLIQLNLKYSSPQYILYAIHNSIYWHGHKASKTPKQKQAEAIFSLYFITFCPEAFLIYLLTCIICLGSDTTDKRCHYENWKVDECLDPPCGTLGSIHDWYFLLTGQEQPIENLLCLKQWNGGEILLTQFCIIELKQLTLSLVWSRGCVKQPLLQH